MNPLSLLERVRKHGKNSNSFLTLYDGFQHFESTGETCLGSVAYVDTPTVWVAAAEPLTSPEQASTLLNSFESEAISNGKRVFMIPVNEEFAGEARKSGFGTVMIGSEPIFEFQRYRPDFARFHSAKHLHTVGARVNMKTLEQLTPEQRGECGEIVQEWLDLRWMAPLSFLNRVNPWEKGEHKRYFLLMHEGRCLGFLAAVPIWPSNGWYLIDLLRRKDAPAGTSELILMEAMRALKEEGAAWVSLGLSPLSRLRDVPWSEHPLLYRLLHFLFEKGNSFYRFKPLFEFKEKLGPTSYPRRYLIAPRGGLRLRDVLSLLHAFVPGGIFEMAWSGAKKKLQIERLMAVVQPLLRKDVVPKALPSTFGQLLSRGAVSLTAATLCTVIYPLSRYTVGSGFGFSWKYLKAAPFSAVVLSPFLHHCVPHLMTNLAFIFSLMIFLELLVGSALTLFLFSLGALFSNLLTLGVLRLVLPEGDWLALSDIGISLGIFGCVGALAHFVRARAVAVVVLHLIIGSIAGLKGDIMQLNHIIAFWIGFLILQTHLKSVMFRRLGSQLINWGAGLGLIVMALAADAQADESASHWIFLPESRHQQYQTYAFLTEEQTSLLYRTGGRGWGEVGGAIALLEASHWAWKPQLILHASANAAYRLKNDITSLLTETIDARVGLFVDFEPSEGHRFSAGWTHYSGHVSDDVLDLDLFNSNMGWESLRVRYFYTRPENFRYGGTLKPIIGSDPGAKAFAADQFFEWYPVGLSGSRQQASPYLATGLEEYGGDRVRLTLQAQAGLLFGNHDRPRHEPGIRAAIGYYNGVDPRLKYAAFKFRTIQFGYAGLFIDL